MKEELSNFIKTNKEKLLAIFALYVISLTSIGMVNYPYIDDIVRRIEGVGNFAAHYSRYLSEYASYLVQGSRHLTDTGLTTFMVSALILTTASSSLLYIFLKNQKISWVSALASVFIGINPWFLEAVSFRFDGPYIALSVLVSVLPFIFYEAGKLTYFLVSFCGLFLMFNSYQGSSGIYIIILLTLTYKGFLEGQKFLLLLKKIVLSFVSYLAAIGLYLFETSLNPELALRGDTTSIAPLKKMPHAILTNLSVYFHNLWRQSTSGWHYLFILLVILFILYFIFSAKINKWLATCWTILYLVLGSIFSFGLYMFFSTPLADDRPRYEYGFGFFIAILLILIGVTSRHKIFNYLKGATVLLLTYYTLAFSFIYASALDNQKEAFENESLMLAEDLNDYVSKEGQNVYISSLFKDSPAFVNSAATYPILSDLVPSNTNLYWPNLLWFKTSTNLNINLVGFDFNKIDMSTLKLVESNKMWDIYQLDGNIYVYMK